MSRLLLGIQKLEASKRGLSDAYVQDEFGVWKPNLSAKHKATGMAGLDEKAAELLSVEKVVSAFKSLTKLKEEAKITGKDITSIYIDEATKLGSSSLPMMEDELARKHREEREKLKDVGENVEDVKVTMTLNQPAKLTVFYENGSYRHVPFIGGETFTAKETRVSDTGKHIVVASPDFDMPSQAHGKMKHIEVSMDKVKALFDASKVINVDSYEAGAAKERIAVKREKVKAEKESKESAHNERIKNNPDFGSW